MIQLISQDEVVSISQWIPITKAYKYEMKPTKNQDVKLNQTLNTCRHLYNDSLAERKDGYENGGWNVKYKHQQNYLPILRNKNDETGKYLRDVYEQVEQNVLKRVDTSYDNFFRRVKNNKSNPKDYKKPGFPRFKGYGRYDSFTFPQYGNGVDVRIYKSTNNNDKKSKDRHVVRLSKIGEIKYISHREIGESEIPYQIKTTTVKKDVDKWSVSFSVDTFVEIQRPVAPIEYKTIEELNEKFVGGDMGLNNLIMLSNRKKIDPPKYLRKLEKRLSIEQRKLSKKKLEKKEIEIINKKTKEKKIKKIKVSSKNRDKQKIKVAKVHRKIKNQRRNFSHEVSRTLVDNYDAIIFENLNIQNMMQNHRLAKSIADASWNQIQLLTTYKAAWAGKIVEFVDPKNTTKECSKCGFINDIKISDRIFKCKKCNHIEDRDIDASMVIRDRSEIYQILKKKVNVSLSVPRESGEFTPEEIGPLSERTSQILDTGSPAL